MPYVSTEALIGAGLVVLLAFGYQHITSTAPNATGAAAASKKKNKKNKKKSKTDDAPSATVSEIESDAPHVAKGKGKKKATPVPVALAPVTDKAPEKPPSAPVSQEAAPPASFASAAGGSTPKAPTKPKTLAEKLVPKPRKTRVDE